MKTLSLFLTLLLLSSVALAQTNVDRLTRALDSLGTVSFNDWKVSPDLKAMRDAGDTPSKPAYDDAAWANQRLSATALGSMMTSLRRFQGR